jgi:hypothetical protein
MFFANSPFIRRLLDGPNNVELSPGDMALLEAHLRQPVSFATIQKEKQATGHSPTAAARNKLKLIRDFNRGLQRQAAPPSPAASQQTEGEEPEPPHQPEPDHALAALLRVYTNGVADERLRQAAQVLEDDTLTAHEKLTKIDGLLRLPATASAEQLGAMLGITKQGVLRTEWWRENRRGRGDEEIERRRSRLRERGKKYERPCSEDGEDER